MKIEALHQFHDQEDANEWAQKFNPSPERLALFQTILNQVKVLGTADLRILELGLGPGFLAEFLLNRLPGVSYQGLDFARPMLNIAEKRLQPFAERITLTQANLALDNWTEIVNTTPQVIVSTWALHDLMSKEKISAVYSNAYEILPEAGVLLNGDFIKPETSTFEYEEGRLKPSMHLTLLESAGFNSTVCLKHFEVDVDNPTTSNNYSCFKAIK